MHIEYKPGKPKDCKHCYYHDGFVYSLKDCYYEIQIPPPPVSVMTVPMDGISPVSDGVPRKSYASLGAMS